MTSQRYPYLPWILVILAFASIGSLQSLYDTSSKGYQDDARKAAQTLDEPLVPPLGILNVLSLGNPSVVADILWLQSIQYFGGGNPYGGYPALGPLMNTITQLDPKDEYPYEFGLIVLPYMNQLDSALTLGQRGTKELPNNGLISFYLASDYLLNAKDYKKAAEYYDRASKLPDGPSASKRLAAVALSQVDTNLSDRLAAEAFWKTVYENATDESSREQAKNWYMHMQMVYQIEKAASDFKASTGRYPNNQEELVKAKLLPSVLVSPAHRRFDLDPKTGKVRFDQLAV